MEILGAKVKGDLYCHYSFRQTIGKEVFDSGTVKSGRVMHDDLRAAFAALTIHLPLILEDLKPGDIADINSHINGHETNERNQAIIEKFRVTEFEVDPEAGGVKIFGTKSLELGIQPIETPLVKWEGNYHYALELHLAVDTVISETLLYIGGKEAPQMEQGDLFADGPQGEIETPEEKPKRGRGRPKKNVLEGVTVTVSNGEGEGVTMTGGEFEDRLNRATDGYTPEPDSEFEKPAAAFHQDPNELDEL